MPWRRPKKQVERPIDVRRSLEESLETASEGEEEEDLVELADLDGASITEAATGDADAERMPTEIADKLRETLAGAVITEVRAVPHAPPETLPEHGIDLSVEAARGLWLKNPVLTASGTFGQGIEYAELIDVTRLGAIVNKGTTPRARPGNPQYRIAETPAGILNSIGLENPGAEEVARKYGKLWAKLGVPVIVNVAGYSVQDYVFVVEVLDGTPGVIAFELNVSCPNVEGGMLFGSDPTLAAEVTRAVRDATDKPVIVKLTPNANDVVAVARACEEAGADGLTTINTVLGMRIDVAKKRPMLGSASGGLSGPAIRPIAVHLTYQVAQAVRVPIIGAGGVTNASDALEFLMAGASAVQVGTATFADPIAPLSVIEGLAAYVRAQGLASIRDIVGVALPRAE
ncbi:MAG TPA: dihydroorotate dehydrogenase [Candidatus Limnocylindria bacterium]|nr:dihydroorotate dehydrogenase [Candidatus Limnocylindria bacterium]